MSKWVSQAVVSSISPASRRRTAYLAPLWPSIRKSMESYFVAQPKGEEVTLAALDGVGKEALALLAKQHRIRFNQAKQDAGLFIAQTLVDAYGAPRVETLRRDDGTSSSARRATWASLSWVESFAPHRLVDEEARVERILLDTNVFRKVIEGDPDALDLTELSRLKGAHPVSLADGAFAEIARQVAKGSVTPQQWARRTADFDSVLDPTLPVAPGGRELATMWGANTPKPGYDPTEARAYSIAAWQRLKQITHASDIARDIPFWTSSGRGYTLALDVEHIERTIEKDAQRFHEAVTAMVSEIDKERAKGTELSEDDIWQRASVSLAFVMGITEVSKLDLLLRVRARKALDVANGGNGYGKGNKARRDMFDMDLLFAIPLPSWIATSDDKFLGLVQRTSSADKGSVMSPRELLDRLEREREHMGNETSELKSE